MEQGSHSTRRNRYTRVGSTVNAVPKSAIRRNVGELQAKMPIIQEQITKQQAELKTIGQTLQGTVLVVNVQSETLMKTLKAVNSLMLVLTVNYPHTQLVSMLMSDMIRHIGSSVDSLAMGIIPPYLVPISLVQDLLSSYSRE